MIESFELERLKSLPIEQVAEALGLSVQRHKCLCPFHQDTHPSLSFHLRTNTFKCFVCGEDAGAGILPGLLLAGAGVRNKHRCGECASVPGCEAPPGAPSAEACGA